EDEHPRWRWKEQRGRDGRDGGQFRRRDRACDAFGHLKGPRGGQPRGWNTTIDVVALFFHALWIAGLAVLLAAFSYHRWLAAQTGRTFRSMLALRSWNIASNAGLMVTSVGFGYGLGTRWWERALWTVLAGAFAHRCAVAARREPRQP